VIKLFNAYYRSIGAANQAIHDIDSAEVTTGLTQEKKDLYIARSKFVRGYNYFRLVELWGEVPLILNTDATQEERTTRRSIDEVYAQIEKDLLEAFPNLPATSSAKSNPTQGAVYTVLAKAYLTWGQKPLTQAQITAIATSKTDPAHEVDAAKLQKAVDYANLVIDGAYGYKLLDDFNSIWGTSGENNAEVIYSISHYGDGIDEQGNHQTHCGFTYPKNERTDSHIQYADITQEKLLLDNDARKRYSYTSYEYYTDGNIDTLTWPLSIVRPGKWIHRSGIYATDVQLNNIDHIDFRYAEILLIKAEALVFLGKSSDALPLVNQIRTRAKIPVLTSLNEAALYKEWANEFAFEQKHWSNLVRWRTYIKSILNVVPTYEYYKTIYNDEASFRNIVYNEIPADPSRFAFYKRIYEHLHSKVENVDGHFYRFAIPLGTGNVELGITPQNPGY
jgi:hypothetical protein